MLATLAGPVIAVLLGTSACTQPQLDGNADGVTIRVFTAASLADAMTEMSDAFAEVHRTGEGGELSVELNVAGSATLREQILAGAPGDVFVSANEQIMEDVAAAGELHGSAQAVAGNSMALIMPPDNPGDVAAVADLDRPGLLIGLCAPGVPCGDFAAALLAKASLDPPVATFEDDVRALTTRVIAGELDVAVVYHSDVVAAGEAVASVAISDDVNVMTVSTAAVLGTSSTPEVAQMFIDFALSAPGQQILQRHGLHALSDSREQ